MLAAETDVCALFGQPPRAALNADDLGAHVGEHHAGHGTRADPGEFDDSIAD